MIRLLKVLQSLQQFHRMFHNIIQIVRLLVLLRLRLSSKPLSAPTAIVKLSRICVNTRKIDRCFSKFSCFARSNALENRIFMASNSNWCAPASSACAASKKPFLHPSEESSLRKRASKRVRTSSKELALPFRKKRVRAISCASTNEI